MIDCSRLIVVVILVVVAGDLDSGEEDDGDISVLRFIGGGSGWGEASRRAI